MKMIIPNRKIEGISAILLPIQESGDIDYDGFRRHVEKTYTAGLTPAVNMDTGYANLINGAARMKILSITREVADGRGFVAGVYVEGLDGNLEDNYSREVRDIQAYGGTPIIFQSSGLSTLPDEQLVKLYEYIGSQCDRMLAFELGKMFAPFGHIYSLDIVRELMQIPQIIGIKHSSLNRALEWQRLKLRDEIRPDFKIYTGNDLAIDMVMYGSDYLLGLSTFAPDYFALRDHFWETGDERFYALNDILQYLGQFAFRAPTAAYKHSAAQFLKLRGWISSDQPYPGALRRPDSDFEILGKILNQLEALN